jgi:hypothetical protein
MLLQKRPVFYCANEKVKYLNGFSSHALIGVDSLYCEKTANMLKGS